MVFVVKNCFASNNVNFNHCQSLYYATTQFQWIYIVWFNIGDKDNKSATNVPTYLHHITNIYDISWWYLNTFCQHFAVITEDSNTPYIWALHHHWSSKQHSTFIFNEIKIDFKSIRMTQHRLDIDSVSYTHLTLPTICSV